MTTTLLILFIVASVWLWRSRAALIAQHKHALNRLANRQAFSLEQQREQSEAVLRSMAAGVLVIDAQCRVVLANPALTDLFALDRSITGLTVLEALREHQVNQLARRALEEGSVSDARIELTSLLRGQTHLSINGKRLVTNEGHASGAVLVCHDITELQTIERSRIDFVANVSHELRTPLTMIKGYSETLRDTEDAAEARDFAAIIERHADRLTTLVEDLLTVSGLESGRIELSLVKVGVHAQVEHVIDEMLPRALPRDVGLLSAVPVDLQIVADPMRLHQVLTNLVENAIKYGREGGAVQVTSAAQGNEVTLRVEDDGPGIPAEARDKIFERFYRLDKARSRETGGTGLGLAIVKHIVLAHGGRVWVEESEAGGAAFCSTWKLA